MTVRNERSMTTIVSHVLSVGITTLLIIGLVASATGFLDDRRRSAARTELETISNRLASELTAAGELATNSDGVRVRTSLPETIAGSTYDARLVNSGCGGGSSTCLRVSVAEYDLSTIVPVHNDTEISLTAEASGTFVITSNGSVGTPSPDRRRLEMSPRIGIGRNVGTTAGLGPGTSFTQPPIPRFTFNPDPPDVSDEVDFDASTSSDPDGSIETWEWDWDGDGTYEFSDNDPHADHTFTTPGDHNVTLRVSDNAGVATNVTHEIDVSGLKFNDDLSPAAPGEPKRMEFTVTNRYADSVTIERVLINPLDNSNDHLNGNDEIEIDVDGDGVPEGYRDYSSGVTIPDDGEIAILDATATIGSTDTASVTIQEFQSGSIVNENFEIGLRYEIGGGSDVGANVFTAEVNP